MWNYKSRISGMTCDSDIDCKLESKMWHEIKIFWEFDCSKEQFFRGVFGCLLVRKKWHISSRFILVFF